MKQYLSASDISTMLGISITAVYALFHRDDFPTTKIGSCYRVERQAFADWLGKHTNDPQNVHNQ